MASLTCTSSVSSNVTFSWSHNGRSVSGSSTTDDASTSILTFTSIKESDVGSYVCTVRSGSVSVMSNAATLTIYGKKLTHYVNIVCYLLAYYVLISIHS